MDFKFTAEQEKFREEVADFLKDEISKGLWKPSCDALIRTGPFIYQACCTKGMDWLVLAEGTWRGGS